MSRKKVRKEDFDAIQKGLASNLPVGAKMALIQSTEDWGHTIQQVAQAATGKSTNELKQEFGNPCPKDEGKVTKCDDCDRYKGIIECSERRYKDEKTGEIKTCSAPCDYMFDSGDICVNCPSAQLLYLGIDCPCPAPGIYRHGEEESDDYEPEYDSEWDNEEPYP